MAFAHDKPRLLWIELNEFDPDYLAEMADALALKHLAHVLNYRHSATFTDDRVEHQGLDPWVQWVGIHSGVPTTEHGVRRLGATRDQTNPQIWHLLAQSGYRWGVWGAMNAPLGNRDGCLFFMPDLWAFDEQAYPHYLNDLLALPRYVSSNYLDLDYRSLLVSCLRLARFFAPPSHWGLLARFGMRAVASTATAGASVHTFATLLDYLSVLSFTRLRAKLSPDFSLIFLNNIAHLQHHFWTRGTTPHPEMKLGLELTDAMLGLLLRSRRGDEAFLLMNGLKQKNVAGRGIYVYRQRNPRDAVEALGIRDGHVESCMTNDAHILFSSEEEADRACQTLDRCRLSDGSKPFFVERMDSLHVFYQCVCEHQIEPAAAILVPDGRKLRFYDLFEIVAERTGAHVPEGDVFADGIEIPPSIHNHEVFNHIASYFGAETRRSVPMPALTRAV